MKVNIRSDLRERQDVPEVRDCILVHCVRQECHMRNIEDPEEDSETDC